MSRHSCSFGKKSLKSLSNASKWQHSIAEKNANLRNLDDGVSPFSGFSTFQELSTFATFLYCSYFFFLSMANNTLVLYKRKYKNQSKQRRSKKAKYLLLCLQLCLIATRLVQGFFFSLSFSFFWSSYSITAKMFAWGKTEK